MPQDDTSPSSNRIADPTDLSHEPLPDEMTADETAPAPEPIQDPDIDEAKAAWENAENASPTNTGTTNTGTTSASANAVSPADLEKAMELAEPYVGQWNKLISTTNWEKGRIISEWRTELMESGVDATQYSDEAWSRRVGGVTAPHVGRLRRVYERFHESYASYQGLYWSHFLAALDWEDAPLWLEGASNEKWSISAMREQRWQAEGAVEANRPNAAQIVEVDTDEDVSLPAQGDGDKRDYDGDSGPVASGPTYEGPDFGDEEELQRLAGNAPDGSPASSVPGDESGPEAAPVQPFIGLPTLPDDLSDAIESLKLAILRHKADGWRDVEMDVVEKYLTAVGVMLRS